MEDFIYLYIGMSGQRMVDGINEDFRTILGQLASISSDLNIRIISNDIKEIKVENGVVYYTTDSPTAEERTWNSLQASWGNIAGTLTDQQDLMTALNGKVSQSDFNTLSSSVGTLSDNLVILSGTVSSQGTSIQSLNSQINGANGILVRLDGIDTTLSEKISSSQILAIRVVSDSVLEYTTDGTTWKSIANVGTVEWGDITGDIANQADLQLVLQNISNAISTIQGDITTLQGHTTDTNNPHQVTKAQVGLGNVDNTADTDKPISTPQITYFNTHKPVIVLTQNDYEALTTVEPDIFYIISDL